MREFMRSFLILLMLSFVVYSQPGKYSWSASVSGGMNISSLASEEFSIRNSPFPNNRSSLTYGAEIAYELTPQISLSAGLNYLSSGGKSEKNIVTNTSGEVLGEGRAVQELNYVEIPIQIKYYLTAGTIGPFLQAGFAYRNLDAANFSFETEADLGSLTLEEGNPNDFKETNFSLLLGGGIKYQFTGRIGLGAVAVYEMGLNNHYNVEGSETSLKPRGFRVLTFISIGI